MNKYLVAWGIVQEVTRRVPGPTITAPLRERPVLTMLSESERLQQFRLSENVHERKTFPIKGRYLVTS